MSLCGTTLLEWHHYCWHDALYCFNSLLHAIGDYNFTYFVYCVFYELCVWYKHLQADVVLFLLVLPLGSSCVFFLAVSSEVPVWSALHSCRLWFGLLLCAVRCFSPGPPVYCQWWQTVIRGASTMIMKSFLRQLIEIYNTHMSWYTIVCNTRTIAAQISSKTGLIQNIIKALPCVHIAQSVGNGLQNLQVRQIWSCWTLDNLTTQP